MKRNFVGAIFLLLLSLPAGVFANESQVEKEIAAIENYVRKVKRQANSSRAQLRFFVNLKNDKEDYRRQIDWREFLGADTRLKQDYFFEKASALIEHGQTVAVYYEFRNPCQTSADYINYYFRPAGSLAKAEARTFPFGKINAAIELFYDPRGQSLQTKVLFYGFDPKDKTKPMSGFYHGPLPAVYRQVQQLPFYKLL